MSPKAVVVCGDWHCDTAWALSVIHRLPELLPDEKDRIILHLGDFGIWPGREGRNYRLRISEALTAIDAELMFIDGNHENFDLLAKLRADARAASDRCPIEIGPTYHTPATRLPLRVGPADLPGARWRGLRGSSDPNQRRVLVG